MYSTQNMWESETKQSNQAVKNVQFNSLPDDGGNGPFSSWKKKMTKFNHFVIGILLVDSEVSE